MAPHTGIENRVSDEKVTTITYNYMKKAQRNSINVAQTKKPTHVIQAERQALLLDDKGFTSSPAPDQESSKSVLTSIEVYIRHFLRVK